MGARHFCSREHARSSPLSTASEFRFDGTGGLFTTPAGLAELVARDLSTNQTRQASESFFRGTAVRDPRVTALGIINLAPFIFVFVLHPRNIALAFQSSALRQQKERPQSLSCENRRLLDANRSVAWGTRPAFCASSLSIPHDCMCRPADADRLRFVKKLRALPSARFGVPSARLRSLCSLQPVPREGTRSACTPGLADGQGSTRDCARGPLHQW